MTANGGHLFGQRLRAARQAQGVTIAELSSRVGRNDDYTRAIECGRRNTYVETAAHLCRALGISLARLLDPAIPITAVAAQCGNCRDTPPVGYRCLSCGTETRTAA